MKKWNLRYFMLSSGLQPTLIYYRKVGTGLWPSHHRKAYCSHTFCPHHFSELPSFQGGDAWIVSRWEKQQQMHCSSQVPRYR